MLIDIQIFKSMFSQTRQARDVKSARKLCVPKSWLPCFNIIREGKSISLEDFNQEDGRRFADDWRVHTKLAAEIPGVLSQRITGTRHCLCWILGTSKMTRCSELNGEPSVFRVSCPAKCNAEESSKKASLQLQLGVQWQLWTQSGEGGWF